MGWHWEIFAILFSGLLLLTGCVAINPEVELTLAPEVLQQRQMQTRRFETTDEQKILKTCAALLQDTGFNIDESDAKLGFLTASKKRDAKDAAQWILYFGVTILSGVSIPPDDNQIMKVFLSTRPVGSNGKEIAVRAVFERIVYNTDRKLSKIEPLDDPKVYQSFFEKLSKALFLEAHDI